MWIKNSDMKFLLEHAEDMPSYIREMYQSQLERAEARQKERNEKKRQERYVLYEAIYKELENGRSCTPTDLQFLLYNRTGKPWSCQRITRLLCEMSYNLRGEETKRWNAVKHDVAENRKPNNRGKSFYHIEK